MFTLTKAERQTITDALDIAIEIYRARAHTAHDEDKCFQWECKVRDLGALLDCMSTATIICEGAPLS
jgi:hypothetical protein